MKYLCSKIKKVLCQVQAVPVKFVAFVFVRLNKLEQFHTFVLQELSNLEEDIGGLQRLEEDVLVSSFCLEHSL